MLKFLDSPEDVLAISLSHTITGEDLDAIMDRADQILAQHANIHLFVHTQSIDGLQLSALPHHLSRSLPMLGQLHRFGRVAVVADQAWMRGATRVESALLPYVSYRVFDEENRDQALAWVFGSGKVTSAKGTR
jgi:hypothetical protein